MAGRLRTEWPRRRSISLKAFTLITCQHVEDQTAFAMSRVGLTLQG
jgi:hypothetical protein